MASSSSSLFPMLYADELLHSYWFLSEHWPVAHGSSLAKLILSPFLFKPSLKSSQSSLQTHGLEPFSPFQVGESYLSLAGLVLCKHPHDLSSTDGPVFKPCVNQVCSPPWHSSFLLSDWRKHHLFSCLFNQSSQCLKIILIALGLLNLFTADLDDQNLVIIREVNQSRESPVLERRIHKHWSL